MLQIKRDTANVREYKVGNCTIVKNPIDNFTTIVLLIAFENNANSDQEAVKLSKYQAPFSE